MTHTIHPVCLNAPTDRICMSDAGFDQLYGLWCGFGDERSEAYTPPHEYYHPSVYLPKVPTDILIAETIPLKDFELKIMSKTLNGVYASGLTYQFNFVILQELGPEIVVTVFDDGEAKFAIHYFPSPENQSKWSSAIVPIEYDINRAVAYEMTHDQRVSFETLRALLLADWYAIQLALLHPQIKTIFSNPQTTPLRKREKNRKKKQRVAKYIKAHYIRPEHIVNALKNNNIQRKTMAWWVIGHYRHYKNGQTRFIQGYWKGPMREMQRNLDEGRERKIV